MLRLMANHAPQLSPVPPVVEKLQQMIIRGKFTEVIFSNLTICEFLLLLFVSLVVVLLNCDTCNSTIYGSVVCWLYLGVMLNQVTRLELVNYLVNRLTRARV